MLPSIVQVADYSDTDSTFQLADNT